MGVGNKLIANDVIHSEDCMNEHGLLPLVVHAYRSPQPAHDGSRFALHFIELRLLVHNLRTSKDISWDITRMVY